MRVPVTPCKTKGSEGGPLVKTWLVPLAALALLIAGGGAILATRTPTPDTSLTAQH